MAVEYTRNGLKFLYPDNWTVSGEGESVMESAWVTLESPSAGYWTVHRYPSTYFQQQIIDGLVAGMEEEYPELERAPTRCRIADFQLEGEQAYFYYLDLLIRWQVMAITRDGQVLLFEWQAEDQEFDQLQPVFEAITTSALAPAAGD